MFVTLHRKTIVWMVPTDPQAVKTPEQLKENHTGPFLNVSQEDWEKLQAAQGVVLEGEAWVTLQRWLKHKYLTQAPDQKDLFNDQR